MPGYTHKKALHEHKKHMQGHWRHIGKSPANSGTSPQKSEKNTRKKNRLRSSSRERTSRQSSSRRKSTGDSQTRQTRSPNASGTNTGPRHGINTCFPFFLRHFVIKNKLVKLSAVWPEITLLQLTTPLPPVPCPSRPALCAFSDPRRLTIFNTSLSADVVLPDGTTKLCSVTFRNRAGFAREVWKQIAQLYEIDEKTQTWPTPTKTKPSRSKQKTNHPRSGPSKTAKTRQGTSSTTRVKRQKKIKNTPSPSRGSGTSSRCRQNAQSSPRRGGSASRQGY